jgi:hypothetical protein
LVVPSLPSVLPWCPVSLCEVAHLLATLQVLPLAERSCSHLLRSLAGLILDSQA